MKNETHENKEYEKNVDKLIIDLQGQGNSHGLTSKDGMEKQDIIKFLCGEQHFNGFWFGDIVKSNSPYWWRRPLRKYIESLQKENERLTEITTCDQCTKLNLKGKISDLEAQLKKAKELLGYACVCIDYSGDWDRSLIKTRIESFISTNEVKE